MELSFTYYKTPRQLYLEGMVRNNLRELDLNIDIDNYGIDWGGPIPVDDEIQQVDVDPINNILSNLQLSDLQHTINPLAEDGNFGINLFLTTLEFIQNIQN